MVKPRVISLKGEGRKHPKLQADGIITGKEKI
jgi:hypothetical protein